MNKMRPLLLSLLLLITSCDIFTPENTGDRKLYLVAIGMGYQQNHRISHLDNTYNDFRGIVEQFETLAEMTGCEYEITTYSDYASINGDIIFGFDHKTSEDNDGPIFHPYTERMRAPNRADLDTGTGKRVINSFISELRSVFESTSVPDSDDLIFFYFTGHGTEKGGPVIHHSNNKDMVYTDITYEELEGMFLSIYGARTISILDCCYSGRAIDNSELGSSLSFRETGDQDGNTVNMLEGNSVGTALESGLGNSFNLSNPIPQHIYITAASDGQLSYEYDIYQNGWNSEKYGAFTYQVLKCWGYDTENMKTAFPVSRKGSSLTLGEMYSYISRNMSPVNREKSTPAITRSRYDLTLFDFSR